MVVDIADELFPDVLEQLKYSWIYLIEYRRRGAGIWTAIVAFLTLLLDVVFNVGLVGFRAAVAASLGLINVVVWVAVVFSTAAPMILSGLYEASVDRQVLHAIERKVRPLKIEQVESMHNPDPKPANDTKKIRYQVHMLYAVLVGNLELWKPKLKTDAEKGESDSTPDGETTDAWKHVDLLVQTLGDSKDKKERERTEARLLTMLQCQASFGATIGAPIAFFLGSFLFSVFSNNENFGDNDTSHAMAFGEWWMTIPHIAIVGGCLLAGNNPNTLEAIVSGLQPAFDIEGEEAVSSAAARAKLKGLKRLTRGLRRSYTYFYKSIYQPVWMWERGRSKHRWMVMVQNQYRNTPAQDADQPAQNETPQPPVHHDEDEGNVISRNLRKFFYAWGETHMLETVPNLGFFAWSMLVMTAAILIVIPWVLAYVTSYYTPTIGLSCRTLTFLLYFLFQLLLAAIWYYDFRGERPKPRRNPVTGWPTWFGVILFLAFVGAVFTAMIGTFLQIVGVYRNCKCFVPLPFWGKNDFSFIISSNSAEMIYYAQKYWLSGGIASIVLLIFFCYMGWWYQRHWRTRFVKVVKDVLMTNSREELERLRREIRADKERRAADASAAASANAEQEKGIIQTGFTATMTATAEPSSSGLDNNVS